MLGPNLSVICLTPVKNEEWILDRFLQCASLWADHIIIADQQSTDASRDIARSFDKVHLIENPSEEFNEPERQKLLVNAARDLVSEQRLLIAIDADEILTAKTLSSREWGRLEGVPPGTVIEFPKIELLHSPKKYFRHSAQDSGTWFPLGYMDDGTEYTGPKIHSNSVPIPEGAPRLRLNEVGILHYHFCDWSRMESKHRWYRCYERLEFPEKSSAEINRQYSWMDRQSFDIRSSPEEWLSGYEERGIDMTSIPTSETFWWDWEILRMFAGHGVETFKGLDIWDVDWERIRKIGLKTGKEGLPDDPVECPQAIRDRVGLELLQREWPSGTRRLANGVGRILLSK